MQQRERNVKITNEQYEAIARDTIETEDGLFAIVAQRHAIDVARLTTYDKTYWIVDEYQLRDDCEVICNISYMSEARFDDFKHEARYAFNTYADAIAHFVAFVAAYDHLKD